MNDTEQLREQMWDLIYGLLSPEESEALVSHIKSDPQAARLYAQVRLQADLVGAASRLEEPPLALRGGAISGGAVQTVERSTPLTKGSDTRRAVRSRGMWMLGIAATALTALVAVGIFLLRPPTMQRSQQVAQALPAQPAATPDPQSRERLESLAYANELRDESAGQQLQIEVPDLRPQFAPNERVQLTLQVVDPTGRPAAGAQVGVQVLNEMLVQQEAQQAVPQAKLTADSAGQDIARARIARKGGELADPPADQQPSPTSGPRADALGELMFRNRQAAVRQIAEEAASQPQESRALAQASGGRLQEPQAGIMRATAPPAAATAESAALKEQLALQAAGTAGASLNPAVPPALYFNSDLVTDSNGKAIVTFVMPPVDSEYRLLIDAVGQGRAGSRQELLFCRGIETKKD